MSNTIIIILGSTNDKSGNISDIGLTRLKKGLEIYKRKESAKLLLTGGYSKGKKISERPYSFYAKQFMLEEGVLENDIVGLVMSKDTVEDAKLSLPIIKNLNSEQIIIVTSDFHMNRSMYIFKKVFDGYSLSFVEAEY
ncbi:MAG: YdcF family protein, partial [Desulfobacteraceae bacterium]